MVRQIRFASAIAVLVLLAFGTRAHDAAKPHPDTLRVVYSVLPPYGFVNFEGEPDGFGIDVLRAVAARADMTLTFHRAAGVTEALQMIADGQADVHPSLVSTAERREVVAYTSSIQLVTLSLYALSHRAASFNRDDLGGMRVAYRSGSATESPAAAILGAVPVGVDANEDVFAALRDGSADLGLFVDAALERHVRMNDLGAQFQRIGPPLQVIQIGIAVDKTQPDKLARLEGALQLLKAEAAFGDIEARWFGPPASWWTPQRLFFAYLGVVAVVVMIAVAAYGRLRNTSRRLLRREARLRAALATRHAAMLELKNAQLASQNEEMQRLLQAVSHDLKSPMVTVRGFAGVLADAMESGNDAMARDACRRIVASTGHLSGITDGLQEYSRVDQKPVAFRDVDLGALVAEAEEMLSADIAAAGARIVVPSPLPHVRADETQLLRVLLNLILNALRHGCPDPGMAIEITAAISADTTEIVVRDHGPGIPDAFQKDVFRLFRRLAPGQSDGTGIGLSIVARVAAKHGGTAWASSPGGGGAALHVTLRNAPDAPLHDDDLTVDAEGPTA